MANFMGNPGLLTKNSGGINHDFFSEIHSACLEVINGHV